MKASHVASVIALGSAAIPASAGMVWDKYLSATVYSNLTNSYCTDFFQASPSWLTGWAKVTIPTAPFFFSVPTSTASVYAQANYDVYWKETAVNEGLPAHLYVKLGLFAATQVTWAISSYNGSRGWAGLSGSSSVSSSGGTGNLLPGTKVTFSYGGNIPPPVQWNGISGAPGKQTVTLSPMWTLVNTVNGKRTWVTPIAIVSPTAYNTESDIAWESAFSLADAQNAQFTESIFFDVTPN